MGGGGGSSEMLGLMERRQRAPACNCVLSLRKGRETLLPEPFYFKPFLVTHGLGLSVLKKQYIFNPTQHQKG